MINIGELLLNNATDEHYNVYPNLDAKYGPYESIEIALTDNTEWVEFNPITVTNEVIWIYAAVAAKTRCGINAIEIIKL